METMKKLPLSFFEKSRPNAPRNSFKDVMPIKWSKEVIDGEKEIIVNLPKKAEKNNRRIYLNVGL